MSDPWKRDLPSAADDAANVMSGYQQQLELELNKPREATPEEIEAWRQEDYWNRGEWNPMRMFVVYPTLIQIGMMGLMASIMLLNEYFFKG